MKHKEVKIERMNVDFIMDKQSRIWLISIDKVLLSERVIKVQ